MKLIDRLTYRASQIPPTFLIVLTISTGILFRFRQYLYNRSLWVDESFLALNIANRSFLELAYPLDYHQAAPIGFLAIEKLVVLVFGSSEYALRAYPLLCGVLSIFLFYRLTSYYLSSQSAIIALGLFAVLEPLIYYASEVKQYSSDVMIALALSLIGAQFAWKQRTLNRLLLLSTIGTVAVWFSHPAVFILIGMWGTLSLTYVRKRQWIGLSRLIVSGLPWVLSLSICLMLSLRSLTADQTLVSYWENSFMPFPPSSITDMRWFVNTFFEIFRNPTGLYLTGVGALTFLLGCIRLTADDSEKFLFLLISILATLITSGFGFYPFGDRMILFLVPFFILLIARGVDYIHTYSFTMSVLVICLLFLHPIVSSTYYMVTPKKVEELRPVIKHIRQQWREGDVIYLYYASEPSFRYYSSSSGFSFEPCIVGIEARNDWTEYLEDLERLRGHERVWFLFSHVHKDSGVDEEKLFLQYLDKKGAKLDSFRETGASVFLYDLTNF